MEDGAILDVMAAGQIGDTLGVTSFAFAPDNITVAMGTTGGWIYVADLANDACVTHGEVFTGAVPGVAWSPDGARLATTSGRQVHLWSLGPWPLEGTWDMGLRPTWDAEISPDGRFVAIHSGPVFLRRVSDGATVMLSHWEDGRLVWALDQTWWADGRGADHMLLREYDEGEPVRMLPPPGRTRDKKLLRSLLEP